MNRRTIYRLLMLAVLLLLIAAVANLILWLDLTSSGADPAQAGESSSGLLELVIFLIFLAAGIVVWPGDDDRFSRIAWLIGLAGYGGLRALHIILLPDHDLLRRVALHLPLTLAAIPLMFWLMVRYSNIHRPWHDLALRVVTGWLMSAGVLLCLQPDTLPDAVRWLVAGTILLAHVVVAAHCYRALSDRNESRTLAAHWHAQAVLLLVVTGFFGAVRVLPGASLDETWLALLPELGKLAGFVALCLGLVNQIVAEMRGQSWRVTGLLPFWTMVAGWWLWLLTLAAMGITQVVFARIGHTESPADLLPLRRFAAGAWALIGIGMVIYCLGLIARRVSFDKES
jgi:hypothetical protein